MYNLLYDYTVFHFIIGSVVGYKDCIYSNPPKDLSVNVAIARSSLFSKKNEKVVEKKQISDR